MKDFFDLRFHAFRVERLVVRKTLQMQDSVYEEVRDHFFIGIAKVFSILDDPIGTDDHVSQQVGLNGRCFRGVLRK